MATKTKAGRLAVSARFEINGETLARVLAMVTVRDREGSYSPPLWARNRTSTVRGVTRLLTIHGTEHFQTGGSWSHEIIADEISRAVAIGRLVVGRFFPEL